MGSCIRRGKQALSALENECITDLRVESGVGAAAHGCTGNGVQSKISKTTASMTGDKGELEQRPNGLERDARRRLETKERILIRRSGMRTCRMQRVHLRR